MPPALCLALLAQVHTEVSGRAAMSSSAAPGVVSQLCLLSGGGCIPSSLGPKIMLLSYPEIKHGTDHGVNLTGEGSALEASSGSGQAGLGLLASASRALGVQGEGWGDCFLRSALSFPLLRLGALRAQERQEKLTVVYPT